MKWLRYWRWRRRLNPPQRANLERRVFAEGYATTYAWWLARSRGAVAPLRGA